MLIYAHADVYSKAKEGFFSLSLHLHSYFVYASSERLGLSLLVCATGTINSGTDPIFKGHQNIFKINRRIKINTTISENKLQELDILSIYTEGLWKRSICLNDNL